MKKRERPHIPNSVNHNLVDLLEEQKKHQENLSFHDRLAGRMTALASTGFFFWAHVAWFAIWILWNTEVIDAWNFDPYPFQLLTMVVSLEAIGLSIFVLIAQNRLQESSDHRAELDLHINLLAERESTMILRKLCRLEHHFKLDVDKNEKELVAELLEDTNPIEIFKAIEKIYDTSKPR